MPVYHSKAGNNLDKVENPHRNDSVIPKLKTFFNMYTLV